MTIAEESKGRRQAGGKGRPRLSDRRLRLHLPRLSRPAAPHPPLGRAPGRGRARLLRHAVEASARGWRAFPAHPFRGDLRPFRAHVSQRALCRLQGASPGHAGGPRPAISADPRRGEGLQRRLPRAEGLRGRRPHRHLRARGAGSRRRRDHRLLRQGPDAARAPGRAHVRHHEEQGDRRGGGDGALRRAAVEGHRGAGADRRPHRQRARRARHRGEDRGAAHQRIWRSRHAARPRLRDHAAEAAREPHHFRRPGAAVADAGDPRYKRAAWTCRSPRLWSASQRQRRC